MLAFASRSIQGLTLKDLGCGGDSTARMIDGGLCHNYTTGNQLGDAEAFLKQHEGVRVPTARRRTSLPAPVAMIVRAV